MSMNYQWYPGHMTKAKRMMQENIKLIDLIIELVDARIPLSSRNPDIDALGRGKSRIVLLNKADLADPVQNKQWMRYFDGQGAHSFAGKACAKTGNKPGVTKGKQWICLNKNLELLDTPGILWPKFEDEGVGMRLAFIGSINDEIIVMEELACDLLRVLKDLYPDAVTGRYGVEWKDDAAEMLGEIARSRGCLRKGAEPDLKRAADILADDFRSGRLGRLTLERPALAEPVGNTVCETKAETENAQ